MSDLDDSINSGVRDPSVSWIGSNSLCRIYNMESRPREGAAKETAAKQTAVP